MTLFLGHSTAFRILRSLDRASLLNTSQAMPRSQGIPTLAKKNTLHPALAGKPFPFDVIVPDEKTRSQSKRLRNHIWKLPKRAGCFLTLEKGLYLAGPELCFIQMGKECSELELTKIGFELCGTYRIDRSQDVGFRNAEPLTNPTSIEKLIEAMPGKVPQQTAKALRFVQDGSASPMETCLALMFGLPPRMGGYGLGMPEMNAEVSISAKHARQVTHCAYHCDLFWPECRVAVEYNSREFHLNETAIERDASRVNNLQAAGISTLAITRAHVANSEKLDAVAHSLARMMGKRIRTNYADISQRRANLRKQLFAKDRWS